MKRSGLSRRSGGIALGGLLALLALLPASADAAVTCVRTGAVLDVMMSATGDFPQIGVEGGGTIAVRPSGGADVCTASAPTVDIIDTINVDQPGAGQDGQVAILLPPTGFGPGLTPEANGISEIEFKIDLGDGLSDSVSINSGLGDAIDHFRFDTLSPGVGGGNLNAPETGGPDGDDIELRNVESLNPTIGTSLETDANIIDARGGPEFSGPLGMVVMNFAGTGGPDLLAGADQANFISALEGDDLVISGPGLDNVDGGPGVDTIDYRRATAGVTVGIDSPGVDSGGGGYETLINFENMTGGPFGDTLTGDNAGSGNVIDGAGGNDTLILNAGNDTFYSLDNGPDTIDCGAGTGDSGVADAIGVDTITNCENVNFPPESSIDTGPPGGGLTNDPTPAYGLSANEPATFEFSVDAGGFAPCPAQCEVSQLADGTHQLTFRAIDSTSLVEQTPVARSVTVDTSPPDTQITSGPEDGSSMTSPSATYEFSSEAGASFQCSTDDGPFIACTTPTTISNLAAGTHAFAVRAIDAAGNGDPTAARRTVAVISADTNPPETRIKKSKVKGRKVTIKFAADEKGSTFKCKLDKGKFKSCKSPKKYRHLDRGKHKFLVLATDAAGNEEDKAEKAVFRVRSH